MRVVSGFMVLAAVLVVGYFAAGFGEGAAPDCAAELTAAIPDRGCAAVGGHRHGDGCDPLGPVRVTATRRGDAFEITTSATLPYRGALRLSTSVPDGVRWIDQDEAWTGEGTRLVRFEMNRDAAASTDRLCGEVRVTMLSADGETFVDTASLPFVDGSNRVREAVALADGRLDVPAVTRPAVTRPAEGGGK